MLRQLSHIARLVRVARTLARHDALFPLDGVARAPPILRLARGLARLGGDGGVPEDGRPGQRLAAALQSLGPAFIKLGQSLATRPDIVGEDVAADLTQLQDRLPPFPGTEARAICEAELGQPLDELFQSFEETPVAAASIAQVHFAVTSGGDPVAVKVLRPGIEDDFARDLETFFWLARLIERAQPALRRLRPVDVVQTLTDVVRVEMDLRLEAAAASELAENSAADEGFLVPAVDWERTARRVLTTERVEGIPITDREAVAAAGHDRKALAARVLQIFLTHAIRDGFFHADMHYGNLFITEDGAIAAVDFGIMGRLDRKSRRYLAEILVGFVESDYRAVARVHFEAGYVPAAKSEAVFAQALRSIGEPIRDRRASEISIARLLAQLFRVTETFDMQTQPQLLLLQKTMVVAEGVARHLDPEANIWDIAEPVLAELTRSELSPDARLREAVEDGAKLARRLPALLARAEQAVEAIAAGNLKLDPSSAAVLAREQVRAGRPRTIALWSLAAAVFLLLLVVL